MYKISDIISKPVFSLYEGINIGTIKSFWYNERTKKIKGFFIFDDETEAHEHFVPINKIFSIGENCLIVKNIKSIIAQINVDENVIMNLSAITTAGADLGKISDIYIDENYEVKAFETTKRFVAPAEKLVNIGRDVVIFDFNEVPIKISRLKPISVISSVDLPEIKVSILNDSSEIISKNYSQNDFKKENKIESSFKERQKQEIGLPKKLFVNQKTIIGKRANKTVIGMNAEVIVKDMQIITDKIYQKAKKHSKLFELANAVE